MIALAVGAYAILENINSIGLTWTNAFVGLIGMLTFGLISWGLDEMEKAVNRIEKEK